MDSEKEIVSGLLKDIHRQLINGVIVETIQSYEHPKWGKLIFKMKTVNIEDPDFAKGTLALDFSINDCSSYLKDGRKEKLLDEIEELINNPEPILAGVTNKYRMLFDYP